jgi:hypothetical protein
MEIAYSYQRTRDFHRYICDVLQRSPMAICALSASRRSARVSCDHRLSPLSPGADHRAPLWAPGALRLGPCVRPPRADGQLQSGAVRDICRGGAGLERLVCPTSFSGATGGGVPCPVHWRRTRPPGPNPADPAAGGVAAERVTPRPSRRMHRAAQSCPCPLIVAGIGGHVIRSGGQPNSPQDSYTRPRVHSYGQSSRPPHI